MKSAAVKSGAIPFAIALFCAWAAAQSNDVPYTQQGQGETTSGYTNPTRSQDKHSVNGNTTTDTHSTQKLGINGGYEPLEETQKETINVDANTTRVVEKRFGRGSDGSKVLLQVTSEETHSSPTGQSVTRSVSNPDVNGNLSVTRREIEKTALSGSDKQEKTTTVLMPDANGGLSATLKTHEVDTLDAKGNITAYSKSVQAPEGNGSWQTTETTKGTMKRDGDQVTKEELVYRPNTDGKMSLAERTVTKELKDADGQKRRVQETYSNMVNGAQPTSDGGLQLDRRVTEVQRTDASGKQTREQQVEQRTAAAPSGDLQTTQKTIDIVRPNGQGVSTESHTVQGSNGNGGLQTVWVDTNTTSKTPSVKVDTKSNAPAQPASQTPSKNQETP